jgi:hypothetical protein
MANIKGTDVMTIKSILQASGNGLESRFQQSLSQKASQAYQTMLANRWTPVEVQAEMYEAAAKVLHPGRSDAIETMFYTVARRSYSAVYRVFMKLPSVAFLIGRAASVWGTFYDSGVAGADKVTDKSFDFTVRDFPNLPSAMRRATVGHIRFLIENAGGRNVAVHMDESNPSCWRWQITYA